MDVHSTGDDGRERQSPTEHHEDPTGRPHSERQARQDRPDETAEVAGHDPGDVRRRELGRRLVTHGRSAHSAGRAAVSDTLSTEAST